MKPITVNSFSGMNNVKLSERAFSEDDPCEPAILLNAFVSPIGRILRRGGSTVFASLQGGHSLWSNGQVMLCVAEDVLYRITDGKACPVCNITTHGSKVRYIDIEDLLYISCAGWTGIYNAVDGTISTWGHPIPSKPEIVGISGDLPQGTYSLCYTGVGADGSVGGNGEIFSVVTESGGLGIRLVHAPTDCLLWITDVNGGEFYLVGSTSTITDITSVYNSVPLPSLDVIPAPNMTCICLFAGRIWGAVGKNLYYTEPGLYSWWKRANAFKFTEDIIEISPVDGGLYVGSVTSTWRLAGTVPKSMVVSRVGNGIIAGTAIGAMSQEYGEESAKAKHKRDIALWIGEQGLMAGNQQMGVESLTEEILKIPFVKEGAGLAMTVNGVSHVLFTLKVSSNVDTEENRIFSEGRLYGINLTGSGGMTLE